MNREDRGTVLLLVCPVCERAVAADVDEITIASGTVRRASHKTAESRLHVWGLGFISDNIVQEHNFKRWRKGQARPVETVPLEDETWRRGISR